MVAGLRIFNKGLRFMDPQDETAKNAPEAIVQGLRNDRADPTGSEPKLSWEKGDILSISFDTEKGTESLKYKIEDELGTGGFAKTYKAMNQTNFQRFVLKFPLQAKWKIDPQFCIESFEAEAKALKPYKDIDHPNLVKFIALGHESASGMPAIVMNYIVGKTLEDQKGKISENQAIAYIQQISSAVKLLHKDNNIHRDISPKNIIVQESDNQSVLLDLGISRSEGGQETSSGTPSFAPPEQTDHLNRVKPNKFHDVYALAVLLYWLVRGTHPTQDKRPSADILSQQTYKAIVFVTKLNKENRMANRPTVDEFLKRLPSDFDSQTTQTTQTTKIEPVTKTEPEIQTIATTTTEIPSVIPDRSPRFGFLAGVLKTIADRDLEPQPKLPEERRSPLNGSLLLSLMAIVCAAAGAIVWFILFRDVPPIIVTPPTTTSRSTTPGLPPAQETPTPVKQETQTVMGLENIPIQIPSNPDRWSVETPELKPEFGDRTIVSYQQEEAIVKVQQYPKPEDWSPDKPYGHLWDFSDPKYFKNPKVTPINFAGHSAFQVTYTPLERASPVQGHLIIVPVETELYFLVYEAPPEAFDRHREEAFALLQSIQFSSTPTPTPTP